MLWLPEKRELENYNVLEYTRRVGHAFKLYLKPWRAAREGEKQATREEYSILV